MDKKDLELQNKTYNTALSLAAAAGNLKTVMIMVTKNRAVMEIPSSNKMMPLYMAALFAKPEMVRYLYKNSKNMSGDFWTHENRGWVLQKCVEAEIFGKNFLQNFVIFMYSLIQILPSKSFVDVALEIVKNRPELFVKKGLLTDVLMVLAQKTKAFKGIKPHIIFRIIKSSEFMLISVFSLLYSTFITLTLTC